MVRGVGGVCDICLARGRVGGVGGEWMRRLDLGFTIYLHLIYICFLTCICLWQIAQIQTCLRVFVRLKFISTSPAFMRGSSSHPAGPHVPKNGNRWDPNAGGWRD